MAKILSDVEQFNKHLSNKFPGAVTKFLLSKPNFLVENGFDKNEVLKIFALQPPMFGQKTATRVGITDVKRLLSLVKKNVFTIDEVKPYVFSCPDSEAILLLKSRYPNSISDDEVLLNISVEDVIFSKKEVERSSHYGPNALQPTKSKFITKQAAKIAGMEDAILMTEVMKS